MIYKPRLPDEQSNVNVSHDHPLKEFVILIFGVVAIVLIAYWLLGLFIDTAVDSISPETEAALFAKLNNIGHPIKGDDTSSDTRQQHLQTLIDDLSKCLELPYSIVLTVEDSEQVNAYALPGGRVVVLSGLLDKVQSENGLAFVLAHELGHFKNRDHLRSMGRQIVLLAIATLLTGSNSDLSQMLTPATSLSEAQYSQHRESEADRVALETLQCHYGHVGGSTEFFEILLNTEAQTDLKFVHYFSTHPELNQRIQAIQGLTKKLDFQQEAVQAIAK